MNQNQRKFLLEAIEKQHKKESGQLRDRRPKAPSLNNYLIASIMDGSFNMKSEDDVRKAMAQRVRDLGKDDCFVKSGVTRRVFHDDDECDSVVVPVDVLFEYPPAYAVELAKYEEELEKWKAEAEALDVAINAMRIKVQIGSDKALEVLIEQADQLCSMSLTASNQLMLK